MKIKLFLMSIEMRSLVQNGQKHKKISMFKTQKLDFCIRYVLQWKKKFKYDNCFSLILNMIIVLA